MKRIALFFAMVIAAVSCAPEEVIIPEIEVLTDSKDLVLSPEEGTVPIAFNVNVDWTAKVKSDQEAWCIVTPSKGSAGDNTMDLIYLKNDNPDGRTATVIIQAMDLTKEILVTQLQKDVLVLTAEKEYTIPYQGQELDFNVSHNLDLKIRSDVEWITEVKSKALEETAVKFVVAPNAGEARTGKITFTAGPLEEVIVVNQDPWVLEYTITPEEDKIFGPEGGEHKITIASNIEYTVKLEEETDWLTMEGEAGEYTFTAIPNDGLSSRDVNLIISPKSAKYVDLAKKINLSQKGAGAKLDVSEAEMRITYFAQSFDLTVDANIDFEMTYLMSVDDEYVAVPDAENWLSHSVSGNVFSFSATENDSWTERSLFLCFSPKDAAYADMVTLVPVYQYGHAFKMWSKQISSIDGYDSSQKLRLAQYGDKLLLANTTKVYLINPATGEVENTIEMPENVYAHSVVVDDAGNVMVAADAIYDKDREDIELVLYHIPDPMNPVPEKMLSYNIRNYYGTQAGNVRVKGNIKENAVITAVVSDGQDGENPEDGAVLMWEVTNGVCSDWYWTNVPYTAWGVQSLCAYPVGDTLDEGLFYIGYGGDYNLNYAASPVLSPVKNEDGTYSGRTEWTTSYVTGSTWMENYNSMHTAEWNGSKYAAILMGCHFDYDNTDMLLLNVDDPAAASLVYLYIGDYDVERSEAWANLWWTGAGTYSDIVLIPTDDALLMIGADSNYGTITCVSIM